MLWSGLTAYIDFFTYPVFSLGIPLITYIAMQWIDQCRAPGWLDIFAPVLSWFFGYGGMWCSKWCISSIITHENMFTKAIYSVRLRSSLLPHESGISLRFGALHANFDILFQGITGFILAISGGAAIINILFGLTVHRKDKTYRRLSAAFLFMMLFPLLWLFLTSQHATIHCWFTFRNLVIGIYALFALYVCIASKNTLTSEKLEK